VTLNLRSIQSALLDHALSSGLFAAVGTENPDSIVGNGLTATLYLASIGPLPVISGLSTTSTRVEFRLMITSPLNGDEDMDLKLLEAVDQMIESYSGEFTLGGLIRNIDVLGANGSPLSGEGAYIRVNQVNTRVFEIVVPCIVNDVWSQNG